MIAAPFFLSVQSAISPARLSQVIIAFFAMGMPLVLVICGFIYQRKISAARAALADATEELSSHLEKMENCSMEHLPDVTEAIEALGQKRLSSAWQALKRASVLRYGGRWMPPLDGLSISENFISAEARSALSYSPSITIASLGLLSALFLYLFITISALGFQPALALIPLVFACIIAAVLANGSFELRHELLQAQQGFRTQICEVLPVYDDNRGAALLVESLAEHEQRVNESFRDFQGIAQKMADADFGSGIYKAVSRIMKDEISPPIRQSANVLADLATHLDQRQMQGMESLAGTFSASVAASLARELNPLKMELDRLNHVMADTQSFVQSSINVLQTSRDENIALNKDIRDSLLLMGQAKNDLANEMLELSDNIRVVSESSKAMSKTYAGEEYGLSEKIKQLAISMESSTTVLSQNLQGSSEILQLIHEMQDEQGRQNDDLHERLSNLISELKEISETLRLSSKNFTQESASYVNQTLKSFDQGLAEVVERLIFTASAIRDAVDALPVALRPGKKE